MTNKIFPRFVVDLIFKNSIENNSKINYACKKLDEILENSVFLKLNLIEKIDLNEKCPFLLKYVKFANKL